jgi:hypothetical protein
MKNRMPGKDKHALDETHLRRPLLRAVSSACTCGSGNSHFIYKAIRGYKVGSFGLLVISNML